MKETMRETLRNHEKATRRARDRSSPSSSSRTVPPRTTNTTLIPPAPATASTSSNPNARRKPVGTTTTTSAPSSRAPSIPLTRKPVGSTASSSSGGSADYTHVRTVTPPAPFPKPSTASSATSSSAVAGQQRRRRRGIVKMYREAPAGDGAVLGALVRAGWREWQAGRRREEVEAEEERRRRYERRRDEGLVRWLEGRMEGGEAGRLGELAGLGGSGRHGHGRSGSTRVGYTRHTAYVHDGTRPDELDVLVSKVTDKFSQWGKEVSERAAVAREREREERQRKGREALKKTISAPRPVDGPDGAVGDAEWAMPGGGRLSAEPSARPSFGSEGSGRPLLDASKTSGSMADRMAKRSTGFEIPFWPRDKKDKKTSAASSAQASPQQQQQQQQQKYTLPRDDEYNRRGTQIGQFMDAPADLAAAPWNQHVNKANPFSPTSGKASADKDKSKHQQRSISPSSFFSKFVPSPTSLFSSGSSSSHHSSSSPRQELQRRGSDDSFFGCVGISVDEERAAQPVNHQLAREGRQLKEQLDFRAPPEGVRELFARKKPPPTFGHFDRGGGRTPFADSDGDGDDDDDDDDDGARRRPPARVSLLNAQHCPSVSDPRVDRHSMAAELVPGSPRGGGHRRGDDDGRNARAVDDDRVSWWDPPSPPPPPVPSRERAAGAGQEEVYTPPRREWEKLGETGGEEAGRAQYWKDYRKKLRVTEFSRASGWDDEGKPF